MKKYIAKIKWKIQYILFKIKYHIYRLKFHIENKIKIRKVINNLNDFCYMYYDYEDNIVLHFNYVRQDSITIIDNKKTVLNKLKNNCDFVELSKTKFHTTSFYINLLEVKEVKNNKVVLKEKYSDGENLTIPLTEKNEIELNKKLTKLKIKEF